jgi:hypothetical protein
MNLKKLLLLTPLFFVFACESEEEINLGITSGYLKGKLKSYIVNNKENGKSSKTEFNYTEKEKINNIKFSNTLDGTNTSETFIYDESGKVTSSKFTVTQGTTSNIFNRIYTYGKDGKVSELKETKENATEINYTFYTYSGDGKLVEYISRQLVGNTNKYQGGGSMGWKNGNIVLLNEIYKDGLVEETDYLFDDKKNPLAAIYNDFLKIPTTKPEYLNQNNISFFKKLFDGSKYKIESVYDAKLNLTSQKVSIFRGNDYVLVTENIFEYYN